MLSPFNLPEAILLLITDQLSSPADFLLHRSLHAHLKESKHNKSVILSVSEGIARWKAIAPKNVCHQHGFYYLLPELIHNLIVYENQNLAMHMEAESLEFIDVVSDVQAVIDPSVKPSLRPIFERVSKSLDGSNSGSSLVVLDDITSLEWIGFPTLDIWRFTRALRALCIKARLKMSILLTFDSPICR